MKKQANMNIDWKGVFPAVTTKFTSEDQLDLSLFKKNILAQIEAGVDGLILGGTLGEANVLTNEEKEKVVKKIRHLRLSLYLG